MATVWLKEKTKLLILKEINKIAAKYGDPLIDTSEILSPSSYLAGQRRNSKKYMRKYNLAYFKERQDKFRRSVSEVIDSYHINYDWIEDNYDKIIARYYFPELLKKDESNGNK